MLNVEQLDAMYKRAVEVHVLCACKEPEGGCDAHRDLKKDVLDLLNEVEDLGDEVKNIRRKLDAGIPLSEIKCAFCKENLKYTPCGCVPKWPNS